LPGTQFFTGDEDVGSTAGTRSKKSSSFFDAPWWAPSPIKPCMFELACGGRPRTRLEWQSIGKLIVRGLKDGGIVGGGKGKGKGKDKGGKGKGNDGGKFLLQD